MTVKMTVKMTVRRFERMSPLDLDANPQSGSPLEEKEGEEFRSASWQGSWYQCAYVLRGNRERFILSWLRPSCVLCHFVVHFNLSYTALLLVAFLQISLALFRQRGNRLIDIFRQRPRENPSLEPEGWV